MNNFEEENILAEPDEPSLFTSIGNGFSFLQANAWFIVAAAALIYYLWTEKLASKYHKWCERRELSEESEKAKKEPEVNVQREEARNNAIKRLQEEYNRQACKMKEIEKQKEEVKKHEFITKHKTTGGRRLNDDYFPLAGGGGRMGYRAPTRSGCPGGSKK